MIKSSSNRLRRRLGVGWLALAMSLVAVTMGKPTYASPLSQEPKPTPEAPLIYIVQSGDTLFGIAQSYGLPVDLMALANDLADPSLIAVGQRLLIPAAPPAYLEHVVQPGETLRAISLRYEVPVSELALANHLLRAGSVAVGERLMISGRKEPRPPSKGHAFLVRQGDTLAGLAAQLNTSPWFLTGANDLPSPFFAAPGTLLWVPGGEGTFIDWPDPFASLNIHPIPAVQGQSIAIHVGLTRPATLTGSLLDQPLVFFASDDGATALAGVNALAEEGLYTLTITAPVAGGDAVQYTQLFPVAAGSFRSEDIVVSPEIAAAMLPDVVQGEAELVDELFATWSSVRQWDGYFSSPTSGDVTSLFGTGRSYNIPSATAYHTGTDLGTAAGTAVLAPADGTVVYVGTMTVRGNTIIIDHGWGVLTGYWHLSASYVTPGEPATQGQHIADIGSTGLATGPHLHWEMRVGGVPVDGLQWLRESFP